MQSNAFLVGISFVFSLAFFMALDVLNVALFTYIKQKHFRFSFKIQHMYFFVNYLSDI